MTRPLRIAFCGASGTGKTTLAKFLSEKLSIPMNPVGSRSVAKAMGFESPYDVDAAGKRGEFQRKLLKEKIAWEREHESFVTDRTTLDNLAYTILHDVRSIDAESLDAHTKGSSRYSYVIYCPSSAFIHTDRDPSRVSDATYQRVYDLVVCGLMKRFLCWIELWQPDLVSRQVALARIFKWEEK